MFEVIINGITLGTITTTATTTVACVIPPSTTTVAGIITTTITTVACVPVITTVAYAITIKEQRIVLANATTGDISRHMDDEVREFLIEIVDKLGDSDSKKEFFLTNLAIQARKLLIKERHKSQHTSANIDPFEAIDSSKCEFTYIKHENEL